MNIPHYLNIAGDARMNQLRAEGGQRLWNALVAGLLDLLPDAEMLDPDTVRSGTVVVERLHDRECVLIRVEGPGGCVDAFDWTTTPERLVKRVEACR